MIRHSIQFFSLIALYRRWSLWLLMTLPKIFIPDHSIIICQPHTKHSINLLMAQVFPTNPEWNYLQFRLQVILADPSVEITKIIKHQADFQAKYEPSLKIDAALEATYMSEAELENACFGNPTKNVFEAGHINLQQLPSDPKKNPTKRTMLLYKLAINSSLPIHKSGIKQLTNVSDFPPEIDAIYVSDSKEELNIYPHKFKVKNRGQVCLQYTIQYVIRGLKNVKRWNPDKVICEYCTVEKAVYYCPDQKELFCPKCFEDSHRSTKKKGHKKQPVTPYNSSAYCSFHNNERLNHYCFQCRELRCEKCLIAEMNKPEKKHKENIQLTELAAIFQEKQKIFMNEAKARTKTLLLKVQGKIKSLGKYYENQQRDLQDKFAAKLAKIREQSNKNMEKCLAAHAELKRKYDQFLWLDNYICYCQTFMPADESIKMKDAFAKQIENLTSRDYFQALQRKIDESTSPPY